MKLHFNAEYNTELILNSLKYFSDSDWKRARSPQSSHCWAWGNWLPSKLQIYLHTQTLIWNFSVPSLLQWPYTECYQHFDVIKVISCIIIKLKLFLVERMDAINNKFKTEFNEINFFEWVMRVSLIPCNLRRRIEQQPAWRIWSFTEGWCR